MFKFSFVKKMTAKLAKKVNFFWCLKRSYFRLLNAVKKVPAVQELSLAKHLFLDDPIYIISYQITDFDSCNIPYSSKIILCQEYFFIHPYAYSYPYDDKTQFLPIFAIFGWNTSMFHSKYGGIFPKFLNKIRLDPVYYNHWPYFRLVLALLYAV